MWRISVLSFQKLGSIINIMSDKIATISRRVSGGEELVVVRRKDFDAFKRWQDELVDALAKVSRGRKEYRERKTKIASSPKELL